MYQVRVCYIPVTASNNESRGLEGRVQTENKAGPIMRLYVTGGLTVLLPGEERARCTD